MCVPPRALVLDGPRRLRLADGERRPLEAGQVRLRSLFSGISHGTELALYRGGSVFADRVFDRARRSFVRAGGDAPAPYPATLGYEMVSEVSEVAPGVEGLAVGDVVHTGTPHQEETVLGVEAAAGLTHPLVRLPGPPDVSRGLFVSLTAIALQAVHDAQLKLGDTVAVIGLGSIGLLVVQLARLNGVTRVVAVDPSPDRAALALRLGATDALDPATLGDELANAIRDANGGVGVDVAIETSGSDRGLHSALAAARLAGTVVTVGFYQGGAANLRLGEEWHHNRLTMVSSMGGWGAPHRSYPAWDRRRMTDTAAALLWSGAVDTSLLPTRTYPFERAPEAYRFIDEHPAVALKVALVYGSS